jgi:hypothetical protein
MNRIVVSLEEVIGDPHAIPIQLVHPMSMQIRLI